VSHRIGVFHVMAPAGGGSYQWTLNIFHALTDYLAKDPSASVTVFHQQGDRQVPELGALFPRFKFAAMPVPAWRAAAVFRRLAVHLPFLLPVLRAFYPLRPLWKDVDLMLFPTTVLDSALCAVPNVFFLADIAHVFYPHFPEVSAGGQLKLRHRIFSSGLANATRFVVESRRLLEDVARHYGADPAKGSVVYQVLPRAFQRGEGPADETPLPAKFLFYPAQLWEHKNHANLLKALALVVKEVPDAQLVLSGSRKPGDQKIFDLAAELGLAERVKYLGYVSDALMAKLYRSAAALVMPTYFGPTNIPTLEAFHFGCPAVISDLPGVEEQTGDAALRFNPDSPEDMAEKVLAVLKDERLRSELVRKGKERVAALSYEAYRDAFCGVLSSAWGGSDLAVVLTGTIVPNVPDVRHADPAKRKAEYLEAIRYYSGFAPVYFLENSSHPILKDPDFTGLPGVRLRQFPASRSPERGKGYQEFEMLDRWLEEEKDPPRRFIKVTGRYLFKNFPVLFRECAAEASDVLVIDQYRKGKAALTQLFYATADLYRRAIRGLYRECDDAAGRWIERALYARVSAGGVPARTFAHEPWPQVVSGTLGVAVNDGFLKHAAKELLRTVNRLFDRRYLYCRGQEA
jgi:glycosyltransferase involved in cell wall biosynthesis